MAVDPVLQLYAATQLGLGCAVVGVGLGTVWIDNCRRRAAVRCRNLQEQAQRAEQLASTLQELLGDVVAAVNLSAARLETCGGEDERAHMALLQVSLREAVRRHLGLPNDPAQPRTPDPTPQSAFGAKGLHTRSVPGRR